MQRRHLIEGRAYLPYMNNICLIHDAPPHVVQAYQLYVCQCYGQILSFNDWLADLIGLTVCEATPISTQGHGSICEAKEPKSC